MDSCLQFCFIILRSVQDNRPLFRGCRQINIKGRTLTGSAGNPDLTMVCRDDFCCYCKPETGSFRFICNEGMKDILSLLMRHTTSVIFNTDADAGICRGEIYNNLSAWLIDGFTGIFDQVKYDLTHFYPVKQVKKYVPHVFPAGFPDSPECFSDRIKQWSEIPRDLREQE